MRKNTDPKPLIDNPGYETRDVKTRAIVYFGIGLFLVLVFSFVSMRWLFGYFSATQPLGPAATPFNNSRTLPPEPRLQVHPVVDLDRMRQSQNELLDSYGWVDRANGKVHIPIERAMDLIYERHLPARLAAPPAPAGGDAGKEEGK
ncbi:MAG: hypothetical protein WB682_10950 [Candidatus Dormiibacterota bacterium]